MTTVDAIVRDALLGFVRQRLWLALIVGTLGLAVAFGYFTSWQDTTFESVREQALEDARSDPAPGAKKLTEAQLEQGLEVVRAVQLALFFGSASFGGNIVAVLMFASIVASPLRRGELRGILVRPITRGQYLDTSSRRARIELRDYSIACVRLCSTTTGYLRQLLVHSGASAARVTLSACPHPEEGPVVWEAAWGGALGESTRC